MNQEQVKKIKDELNRTISNALEQHLSNVKKLNDEIQTKGGSINARIIV